jgi:hypothetical protein
LQTWEVAEYTARETPAIGGEICQISMFSPSFWTKLILMFYSLFVFVQSATSSANSLSAISISFGSLINCISCSWI